MPPVVVMSAIPEELTGVLAVSRAVQDARWGAIQVYAGSCAGREVVAFACGIGKVRASAATQFAISRYHPSVVLIIGAAGALHERLGPGTVVVAERVIEHDFDSRPLARNPQAYRHRSWTPGSDLVKEMVAAAGRAVGREWIRTGTVLTGDQCIVAPQQRGALRRAFDGDCVEMEGAAVAGVCAHNDTPFAIVRVISDAADPSARNDFIGQLKMVSLRAGQIVEEFLRSGSGVGVTAGVGSWAGAGEDPRLRRAT